MKKLLNSNKNMLIIGLVCVIFILFYSYTFFLESDGCTVKDLPELITHPSQLSKHYCGDVEALKFLPIEVNGILSIILNSFFWISLAGAFLLPIGIVRALYRRFFGR